MMMSTFLDLNLLEAGEPREAAKALEKVVGLYAGHVTMQFHYGKALFQAGDAKAAVAPLEEANRVNPFDPRVHELLADDGVEVAYQTLTAFCRRHEIGTSPKEPSGHYEFAPGQEMQHDTSPHRVEIASQQRVMHCASLVLAYSRALYAQLGFHEVTTRRGYYRSPVEDAVVLRTAIFADGGDA